MATTHHTEAQQIIRQAATQLATLDFIDQCTASECLQLAEAIANLFTVVFYQAETGRATHSDFNDARTSVQQRLRR
ncbi:type I toxin-antitoxin system ptaRNA1 family toxin [Burkholderia cepacia]|uniref:type I toxin-antitoxin system ptaRNA1 family toxin n=1 Tax=Burkholderia cepacia TaxID=292 RepID=UPI0009BDD704|nr:type I toxin-antitoxin system ptaRNA1 family toxin [Burkholderia cepacia]